jgi:hypothetical protein
MPTAGRGSAITRGGREWGVPRACGPGHAGRIMIDGAKRAPQGPGVLTTEAAGMRLIQTTIEVDEQRRGTIQLPADVPPGPYQAVVVLEDREPAAPRPRPTMADFPRHEIPWPFPAGFTFRREEIYGDDGR